MVCYEVYERIYAQKSNAAAATETVCVSQHESLIGLNLIKYTLPSSIMVHGVFLHIYQNVMTKQNTTEYNGFNQVSIKFINFGSMCTIMYGYAQWSGSSCGQYKARTGEIWSFDALQGNRKVHSAHPPILCLMTF